MNIKESYSFKLAIYIYKRFLKSSPIILIFLICLIINFISWFIVSFKGRPESYIVPLHYLSLKGIDKTGYWYEIYNIPLAGAIILFTNTIISYNLKKRALEKASLLLMFSTTIMQLFILLAAILITFRI